MPPVALSVEGSVKNRSKPGTIGRVTGSSAVEDETQRTVRSKIRSNAENLENRSDIRAFSDR
jgi:hypothetical protein